MALNFTNCCYRFAFLAQRLATQIIMASKLLTYYVYNLYFIEKLQTFSSVGMLGLCILLRY